MQFRLLSLVGLANLALALAAAGGAQASTASNANSPLGVNLMNMNYYNPEQPFLNVFKTTGVTKASPTGWWTHTVNTFDTGEEAYLQLDANGYPTTLTANSSDPHSPQLFTSVGVLLFRNLPNANAGTGLPYRAGQYVVLYDGQGTLTYGFDAKLVSSAAGRDVINVGTPSSGGIDLRITATDPSHTGNYLRNIRVVKAEEESLLTAGNVFEPYFLNLMKNFRVLRAIQWLEIDDAGGLLTTWASRPQLTDGGWGGPNGVPLEAVLQLCNAAGADCWLNIPHQANSDYVTQMANLAHANLGTNQKVYIEFSNEVWNGSYAQFNYAIAQGRAMWPSANVSAYSFNASWYGMRVAQMCDAWKTAWGADSARVVCVASGQAGNTGTVTQILNCQLWTGAGNAPCAAHHIDAVAIAPYFAQLNTATYAAQAGSPAVLSNLFAEITNPNLPQVASWETELKTALAPYKLPFIAYEGGQSLVCVPTCQAGAPVINVYVAANRDPRMAMAYTTALNDWKANGGHLYVTYADIYSPGQYGEWGALESFQDQVSPLSSAPPKWQAIQNFITKNPCWWAGCVGTVAASSPTPAAPVLTVVK
jgi:hypothetical protein